MPFFVRVIGWSFKLHFIHFVEMHSANYRLFLTTTRILIRQLTEISKKSFLNFTTYEFHQSQSFFLFSKLTDYKHWYDMTKGWKTKTNIFSVDKNLFVLVGERFLFSMATTYDYILFIQKKYINFESVEYIVKFLNL